MADIHFSRRIGAEGFPREVLINPRFYGSSGKCVLKLLGFVKT